MQKRFAHTSMTLSLIAVGWVSACVDEARDPAAGPPVTATPGTALHHAQTCAQRLGRIPTWACRDGVPIPVLVGGQPVTTSPTTCDNPDLKGQCAVGSYVGRLPGQNHDGSTNPNVSWAYFCRRDDDFAQMIGYDKTTGATCFFELKNGAMPLDEGVPVGKVPGVDVPEYESLWKAPAAIAVQRCSNCHTPDPFIHTPYVDAARLPTDPSKPMVPEVATPSSPYFVLGDAFANWSYDHVEFDDNKCTSCHRMPDFRRFTSASRVDFNAHMPPLAPGSMKPDFDAVMACLNAGPEKPTGCRWTSLNGAPSSPKDPPKTTDFEARGTFTTTFGTLTAVDPFTAGSGTFSGGEITPEAVGAVAGPTSDPAGFVALDVIGRKAFPNIPGGGFYIARFTVPKTSFSAGRVFDLATSAGTFQLLFAASDRTRTFPVGPVTGGVLTLSKAGTQSGDAVEGSFVVKWQDGPK